MDSFLIRPWRDGSLLNLHWSELNFTLILSIVGVALSTFLKVFVELFIKMVRALGDLVIDESQEVPPAWVVLDEVHCAVKQHSFPEHCLQALTHKLFNNKVQVSRRLMYFLEFLVVVFIHYEVLYLYLLFNLCSFLLKFLLPSPLPLIVHILLVLFVLQLVSHSLS